MTLYRGVAAARQVETTETSSTSEQKPVSFGSVVSKVTAPQTEVRSTSSIPSTDGCHLCGHQEGGTCCSTCHKIACSQHIRVRVHQNRSVTPGVSCIVTALFRRTLGPNAAAS
eukprot:726843-Amphidinium_carterae.2